MVEGPSTNLYQIGLLETCSRINGMVARVLNNAGLAAETTLEGLGLREGGDQHDLGGHHGQHLTQLGQALRHQQ